MTFAAVMDVFVRVAGAIGLPTVLGGWWLDRRSHRAAADVAENTVRANIIKADAGGLEAWVLTLEKAFEAERKSKDRLISGLEEDMRALDTSCKRQVRELTQDVRMKDALIERLRGEVDTLTGRLADVTEDLVTLRDRLEGTG